MTTPNRVVLKPHQRLVYEEAKASVGTIKPGHLVSLDSNGELALGPSIVGSVERLFAIEDGLRGSYGPGSRDLWDAYSSGEIVPYVVGQPGDEFLCRIAAGAAVTHGDRLISYGDGTLVAASQLVTNNLLANKVAASTAISNTVSTEQDFDKTYTIPANSLKAGDLLRIRGHVVVSAQASTDTLTVKVYIGSTAVVTTAAVDAAVGDIVFFDILVVIRTIGASGTMVASFLQANGVPGTVTAKPGFLASTTIDTTAAKVVKVSATWSATSATNTCALQSFTVSKTPIDTDGQGYFGAIARAMETVDNGAGLTEALVRCRII